jgi:hypothetical protein
LAFHVKTSRARNKIRHFINVSQREWSIEIGKKILEKEAKKFKINLKKLIDAGPNPENGQPRIMDLPNWRIFILLWGLERYQHGHCLATGPAGRTWEDQV